MENYLTNAKSRLHNMVFSSDNLTVENMIEAAKVEVLIALVEELKQIRGAILSLQGD